MATILVIDDRSNWTATMEMMLEGKGHTVITASSGQEGLDKFRAQKPSPDAVLTDKQMPQTLPGEGEEGIKLTEAIRSIDASVPIVIWSGDGFSEAENVTLGRCNAIALGRKDPALAVAAIDSALGPPKSRKRRGR
jgi:CheY-like chemotaxis protein